MPFLTINGIDLGVLAKTLRHEHVEIGERGRAIDGTAWSSVRARKRRWSFRTTPMSQAEALAWRALLHGPHYTASFYTDLYTDQGLLGVATDAEISSNKLQIDNKVGAGVAFACPTLEADYYSTGVTVAGWVKSGAESDKYYVSVHRYGDIRRYVDSVASETSALGIDDEEWTVIVVGTADATRYAHDLIWFPAAVPEAWVAQMRSGSVAIGTHRALPLVDASGDMIAAVANAGHLAVRGHVVGSEVLSAVVGGSLVHTAEQLDIELEEY